MKGAVLKLYLDCKLKLSFGQNLRRLCKIEKSINTVLTTYNIVVNGFISWFLVHFLFIHIKLFIYICLLYLVFAFLLKHFVR